MVVADDHHAFRQALDAVLGLEDDIDIVAQASNAEEAARRVETLRPDVVLMDIRMPAGGGIEATRRIHELAPEVKVLILTVSDEESDLYEAIKAGANGYLLKEIALEDVAEAVRALRRGESLITPSMASKLLNEFSSLARQAEPVTRQSREPTLTARESEVLRLLAAGLSNREIADELIIAENTVKNHVRNILDKLHLRSRVQAATYAFQARLVKPREDP